jgi:hypothetical protein
VSVACCPVTGLDIPECSCRACCRRLIERYAPGVAPPPSDTLWADSRDMPHHSEGADLVPIGDRGSQYVGAQR